eukprot:scaffold36929_cov29-Phaeocystis_antarctica.AAC.1
MPGSAVVSTVLPHSARCAALCATWLGLRRVRAGAGVRVGIGAWVGVGVGVGVGLRATACSWSGVGVRARARVRLRVWSAALCATVRLWPTQRSSTARLPQSTLVYACGSGRSGQRESWQGTGSRSKPG